MPKACVWGGGGREGGGGSSVVVCAQAFSSTFHRLEHTFLWPCCIKISRLDDQRLLGRRRPFVLLSNDDDITDRLLLPLRLLFLPSPRLTRFPRSHTRLPTPDDPRLKTLDAPPERGPTCSSNERNGLLPPFQLDLHRRLFRSNNPRPAPESQIPLQRSPTPSAGERLEETFEQAQGSDVLWFR